MKQTEQIQRLTKAESMDAYYELFDLASGNMVEDYDCEQDAMEALIGIVGNHGSLAIATFALTHVENGHSKLIAMQDNLVARVEKARMERLVAQLHAS